MKTKKQLQNRIEEIKKLLEKKDKMFECYGRLETKMNDWKGFKEEIMEYQKLEDEWAFITQIIEYIF